MCPSRRSASAASHLRLQGYEQAYRASRFLANMIMYALLYRSPQEYLGAYIIPAIDKQPSAKI